MKIIKIMVGMAITTFPITAMGGSLMPAGAKSPGGQCYPADNSSVRGYTCNGSAFPTYQVSTTCPADYDTSVANMAGCTVVSGAACGTAADPCIVCFGDKLISKSGSYTLSDSGWVVVSGTNRVSKTVVTTTPSRDSTYVCSANATSTTTYACKGGSYYASGSGSTITCNACPANATCTSTNGHTDRFKCNDGYYASSTATSCTRCPSSGGVYGLTGKTGATAITECYVPGSAVTGSDSAGSYTYTDEKCYYEN